MKQAVEAQVLNPHCELGEQGQWDDSLVDSDTQGAW